MCCEEEAEECSGINGTSVSQSFILKHGVIVSEDGEGILGPEAVHDYKKTDASDTAWQLLMLTLSHYGNKLKMRASSS